MQKYLQQFSLRELRLMALGLGAVITAAIVGSVILPKVKALQSASTMISVLEEASQDGAELGRRLDEQHARNKELGHRLHGDMANLPARQVESYIIGQLQKLSWNNDIELVSVRPSAGEQVQVFQEMLFRVELAGQYGDLYRWLWEARRDLGFVVVKELSLRRSNDIDNEPKLHANLNLASYRTVE